MLTQLQAALLALVVDRLTSEFGYIIPVGCVLVRLSGKALRHMFKVRAVGFEKVTNLKTIKNWAFWFVVVAFVVQVA